MSEDFSAMSDTVEQSDSDNQQQQQQQQQRRRKHKTGVLYLSIIPQGMSVSRLREQFEMYSGNRVGRISLTEKKSSAKRKRKPNAPRFYTEGWVEILSKRRAKQMACELNNQPMGGRKKNRWYDFVWNIKYLPGFKWMHLTEQLRFERAVRQDRLRTEIALAKKEANFYRDSVARSERMARTTSAAAGAAGGSGAEEGTEQGVSSGVRLEQVFRQRQDAEYVLAKLGKTLDREDRLDTMKRIGLFGAAAATPAVAAPAI